MSTPRVIASSRSLRIVKVDQDPHYVLEKFGGRDAMGVERWTNTNGESAPLVKAMRDWILRLVKELPEETVGESIDA